MPASNAAATFTPAGSRPGALLESFDTLIASTALAILVLTMTFTHLLDLMTTAHALSAGLPEMNPLSAGVIANYGMSGLVVEKLAVVTITAYNMGRLPRNWALTAGILTTAMTAVAVLWNLHLV